MLAGENFGEFGNLLRICQSFICQLLAIFEKAIEAGLKFAKVFFAKIFHYTVTYTKISFRMYLNLCNAKFSIIDEENRVYGEVILSLHFSSLFQ